MNSCNYCSKTYAWPYSLKRHIKRTHTDLDAKAIEPRSEIDTSVKAPGNVTAKPSAMEQHEVPPSILLPVRESKLKKISEKKFVSIRKYRGEPRVNIRKYIRDSQGKPYATKCGIMLTATEWKQLEKSFKDINASLCNHV